MLVQNIKDLAVSAAKAFSFNTDQDVSCQNIDLPKIPVSSEADCSFTAQRIMSRSDLETLKGQLDCNSSRYRAIENALLGSGTAFFVDQETGQKYTLLRPFEKLLGGGYGEGDAGMVCGTLESAMEQVRKMKSDYGNGVSTLIIVHNASAAYLEVTGETHSSGRCQTVPQAFYPGQYMAFLHVKSDGAARGSCGSVTFTGGRRISWETPWWGANGVRGSAGVTARILENNSSPMVLFTIR